MPHNTVSKIIYETCDAIWDTLHEGFMPFPTTAALKQVSQMFYERFGFPNCVGAIDGKHIRIKCPNNSGSNFFNYKKFFSIHLQAVADADRRFIFVDVGDYGRRSTDEELPFVLIGDQGYPLKKYLLRPYAGNNLDPQKEFFNEKLSSSRNVVECAFGLLVAKWRCLKTEIQLDPDNVDKVPWIALK
ncbi:uncharacterized protein LOC131293771 [Anopheles ziemanni]|uniref:uncharacterized protein LOC131264553 n=1 Tax=Anopheles coustani TaxID=139045 RepID=UPI0026597FAF|nr:uncharacterized protein LOC131264553 [Anopheles coustani]XP_058177815.1 uncharacterized protein LOC131293771 [Anopheles ziemanni]